TAVGQLRLDALRADARTAVDQAELMVQAGRFESAAGVLAASRAKLLPYAAEPAIAADLARLDLLAVNAHEQARAASTAKADTNRRSGLAGAQDAQEGHQQGLRDSFHEQLARVEALESHAHYDLALATCRHLLREYPGQDEVQTLFNRLISEVHDQRRLSTEQRDAELHQEVLERMERELIPSGFDGEPIFATDWDARHGGQSNELAPPARLPEWHEQLLEKLNQRVSIDFEAQNAVDVFAALQKQANVNVIVDPSVFAGGDHPISLKARDMTLENVLTWACRLIGQTWHITNGAIYIGGTDETRGELALYDISNLVFQPQDQIGMGVGLPTGNPSTGGGGGGRGGGGGGGGAADLFKTAMGGMDTPAIAPEDVKDLIVKAVSPATWTNDKYSIEVRGHDLFVNAPPSVHLLIQQFIRSQANVRHVLVRVDVRWIELDDSFLEEIGVDWTTKGGILNGPDGTTNGYHRTTDSFDHAGSLTNVMPATAFAPAPPTLGTGLSLSSTFLKSTQLANILRAVERNQRGTILQAPSVTTMNGVRGSCFFGHQIGYIGGYDVGAGNQGVTAGLAPQINVINIGANLSVKPFVSSDGKFVTLDLYPAIASVDFFLENVVTTRAFATGAPDPITGQQNTQTVRSDNPIELPNVLLTTVATTVTIPDRGTLLVGGFGNHLEQATSTKIPFLGHIPFLGRLFGARGRYSVRFQLYLLTTVTVINYDELEANL
ncbi:MAG: hypothetical protein H0X38_06775, partial [Planctomycetes bacterium]|nr:hypothetical protein [Planctomycetota bacterium]